jgi:hypothetical protein
MKQILNVKISVAEPDPGAVILLLSGAGAVITNYDFSSAMDSASVSTMLIRIQGFAGLRVKKIYLKSCLKFTEKTWIRILN